MKSVLPWKQVSLPVGLDVSASAYTPQVMSSDTLQSTLLTSSIKAGQLVQLVINNMNGYLKLEGRDTHIQTITNERDKSQYCH